jgi:hypothetical protein
MYNQAIDQKYLYLFIERCGKTLQDVFLPSPRKKDFGHSKNL